MSGPQMRFAESAREAWRNVASGTSRAVVLTSVVGLATSLLAAADTMSMTGVIGAAEAFRERGGSIAILTAEGAIDGRACDALVDQPGVRAAGAVAAQEPPLTVAGVPQNPLTFFAASPGFSTMLPQSTGQEQPGLLLPEATAESLGLSIGDPVFSKAGDTVLGGTYAYPDDGRPRGMGYAAIAPTSADRPFDECWLDAYPVTPATTDLLYTAIAADASLTDAGLTVSQHNQSLGQARDPATEFTGRMTALFPLGALGLGAGAGFLAVWSRRLEIASALHSGVHRLDQTATTLLEALAWSAAGAATSIPVIALLTQRLTQSDHLRVVLTASHIPTMVVAGVILGTLAAVLTVRESRLFAYFKDRQ